MPDTKEGEKRRELPTFLQDPLIWLPFLLAGGLIATQFFSMWSRAPVSKAILPENGNSPTAPAETANAGSKVIAEVPTPTPIVPSSSYTTYKDAVILEKGAIPESGVVFPLFGNLWECATITSNPHSNTAIELYLNQLNQSLREVLSETHLIVQHTPQNDIVTPTNNIHHPTYHMMDEKTKDQACIVVD